MIKPETKFKQFVRQKLGLTKVTQVAQMKVWATLPQANKNKYGGWKPTGVKNTSPVPTITLVPTNICVLGEGAYGKVCVRKTPGGTKYAVKTTTRASSNAFNNLMKEKATHMKFYYGLPDSLKKYFPRPVNVKGEPNVYAMTMFDGITLYKALLNSRSPTYKRNVINKLRKAVFALWTSGYIHGDLHMSNIMVSKGSDPEIKILDFGMMRRSNINVPNKKFKTEGIVGYKNLTNKWEKWFKSSWKEQLRNLGLNASNPNMVVFPKKMGNLKYYAKHHKLKFDNLNKHGNQHSKPVAAPKKAPPPRGLANQRLKKYKQLVRNRTGAKRVTVQGQVALWKKLSNKNKEQFGSWKPEGVVKHRISPRIENDLFKPTAPKAPTPPKAPKAPKPTMNQYMMNAFMAAPSRSNTLLRFWMTHYTTEQKKEIYKKISDPEQAKKDFPLCK